MNDKNETKAMCTVLEKLCFLESAGSFTSEFFKTISVPLAEELYHGLDKKYCDASGASVAGDLIIFLLDKEFIDSASSVLEYLYGKSIEMPESVKQFYNNEKYAKMFLREMADSLIKIAEVNF